MDDPIFIFREDYKFTQVLPVIRTLQMSQIRRLAEEADAPHNHGQGNDEPRPRAARRARRHSRCAEGGSRRSSSVVVHGDLAGRALAEHDSTAGVFDLWVRAAAGVAASLEPSVAQRCAAAAATLLNYG